jgi:hypothetical protein
MQAHPDDSEWATYEVAIKVTVKAQDYKAAKGSLLTVLCGDRKEGHRWTLIEKGRPKVLIIPPETDPEIRVTKREVI